MAVRSSSRCLAQTRLQGSGALLTADIQLGETEIDRRPQLLDGFGRRQLTGHQRLEERFDLLLLHGAIEIFNEPARYLGRAQEAGTSTASSRSAPPVR